MEQLLNLLDELPEYRELRTAVEAGEHPVTVYGLLPVHAAHFTAALARSGRPVLAVCRDEGAAEQMARDLSAFSGREAGILPGRDLVFHDIETASRQGEQKRLRALYDFGRGELPFLVTTAEALQLQTMPPQLLQQSALTLRQDEEIPPEQAVERLLQLGYTRCDAVEGPGQFALRGGILDVFAAGEESPVRAEFWGDAIDSLGLFDPMTQRRSVNIPALTVLPVREALPGLAPEGTAGLISELKKIEGRKSSGDALKKRLREDMEKLEQGVLSVCDRYLPQMYHFATALDHLPDDTLVVVADAPAVRENARGTDLRLGEGLPQLLEEGVIPPCRQGYYLSESGLLAGLSARQTVAMDSFASSSGIPSRRLIAAEAKQLACYGGSFETALGDISGYLRMGYRTAVLAGGQLRAKNLAAMLREREIPCDETPRSLIPMRAAVCNLALSAGFEYPAIRVAVLAEGQPGPRRRTVKKSSATNKDRLKSFADLHPGDLVVHEHHGIGRFVGVEQIAVDGARRDYMKIAYAGTDFVYVPATGLDLVTKYIGAGEDTVVKLSKLGGAAWVKTKTRAKKAVKDLAEQLVKLYAARQSRPGYAFAPDDDWQRSFEEAFPYEETEDQLAAVKEIKSDMQSGHPMDRLLCGDVGFGKTEVAFRAVMKCILSGKQAAILVPTTVLARQHYLTALQRFSGNPVQIDTLSRFRTPNQQKDTVADLRLGRCDLVVGTHRLLQKDVQFKNLGLLIVDEEQRFGVSHKEQIKQMAEGVDVLTLSATPIPRTLNMALSGIRDMSVLEEPPTGRQPVQTYVLEHNEPVLRDAIRRELARGGQIYYLHNRVESIEKKAAELRAAFPDRTVAVAHGQMGEEGLGRVMAAAYAGEVDILVCTTIIETGVDIPNVNTLVIEDADRLGLAQMHQIRGRVGRSPRRAYAYLTYRKGKVLTEIAQKRLSAIREFAEFGSGFKIAMRDLEIRGAGNVLGAEQSGHLVSVGYDLYLQLLEEAAAELKGEPAPRRTACTADLLVSANLPASYVSDGATRVDLYRRIALISCLEEYRDMQDELLDRFGDLPKAAQALLDIALLRADASGAGISDIVQKNGKLQLTFDPRDLESGAEVCAGYKGRMLLSAGEKPYLELKLKPEEAPLATAREIVDRFVRATLFVKKSHQEEAK